MAMAMSRQLIVLNAALVLAALAATGYAVRELRVPPPVAVRRPPPPGPAGSAEGARGADGPVGSYNIVASRNLFSPTRSEAPVTPGPAAANVPKPNLFGIVLRDGAPLAYLEDPTTKRVAGYRLGDTIAGGTVTQIASDHVVVNRPDGDVNVRLRDPSKPRPAAPPVTTAVPQGQPGAQGPPTGAVPQPAFPTPTIPQAPPAAMAPPLPPGTSPVLPRRPLPPNLLRRLPPPQPSSDAPAQN